jgi:diamine N-acetyltransferase
MAKLIFAPIKKGGLRLRLLEENDLPLTLFWRNQVGIREWFLNPEIISAEQHQSWFRDYQERENDYVFVIEETERYRGPIGQISLYQIDRKANRAELGRLMIGHSEAVGQGLGRLATELLIEVAFDSLDLEELFLTVRHDNTKAIAIYQSCGFRQDEARNNIITMTKRRES